MGLIGRLFLGENQCRERLRELLLSSPYPPTTGAASPRCIHWWLPACLGVSPDLRQPFCWQLSKERKGKAKRRGFHLMCFGASKFYPLSLPTPCPPYSSCPLPLHHDALCRQLIGGLWELVPVMQKLMVRQLSFQAAVKDSAQLEHQARLGSPSQQASQ